MYDDLKEQAVKNIKKERQKKRGVYVVGFIFASLSAILFIISLNLPDKAAFWIKFPILVFAMVYGIIYFGTFGFPFLSDTDEMTQEEIEREMVKIYKLQSSTKIEDEELSERLELREIEELKDKWENEDDFV